VDSHDRSHDGLGHYSAPTTETKRLFRFILERYLVDVTPLHKGAVDEGYRIRQLLRDDLASYALGALSPIVMREYRDRRLRKVKPGTARRDLELIRAIINHARKEWEVAISNPVEAIKLPKKSPGRNRRIAPDEEKWLLKALKETPRSQSGKFVIGARNPWLRPAVEFAVETAMRRSEFLRLEWEHVNFEARTAFLPETKNGESRTVPLSSRAMEILEALPRTQDDRVFPVKKKTFQSGFELGVDRAVALYRETAFRREGLRGGDFLV